MVGQRKDTIRYRKPKHDETYQFETVDGIFVTLFSRLDGHQLRFIVTAQVTRYPHSFPGSSDLEFKMVRKSQIKFRTHFLKIFQQQKTSVQYLFVEIKCPLICGSHTQKLISQFQSFATKNPCIKQMNLIEWNSHWSLY